MQILIVGAGSMGFTLAQQLDEEGHRVVVVDRDPDRVELARTQLDVMGIVGSGLNLKALREADLETSDLLIAATDLDEVNIVACLLAREIGVRRRIARVHFAELLDDIAEVELSVLGVDELVNPAAVTVGQLYDMITTPGTLETAEFAEQSMVLRGLRVTAGSRFLSASLQGLRAMVSEPFVITGVRRGNDFLVPRGPFKAQEGDIIYVVTTADHLQPFLRFFGFRERRDQRIILYGASTIGRHLAARLERVEREVILIEPSREKCTRAAEELRHTSVIHGSALDSHLMEALHVGSANYFVGVSDSEETNLTGALWAKRLGVRRAITLTQQPDHVALFEDLPVDAVVCPISLTAGVILRRVREGKILSLFRLAGGRGEALEVVVQSGAPAAGRAIKEVDFPEGVVLAAVVGASGARIAGGETQINAGDRVVMVVRIDALDEALALFGGAG
ncbi:MAG: Trk system potassium transporter TrkA [Armatimonadia bacterium]|nr:Trk system potassium transporter TrkA [Armatimonadia bacterium]